MRGMGVVRVLIESEHGVVADIDGTSTADALAYFLRSRGIVDGTHREIENGIHGFGVGYGRTETISFEQRDPISGALKLQYVARVPEGVRP